MQYLLHFFGVDRNRDGVPLGPVQHPGRQALHAQPARFVLTARAAWLGGNCNLFPHIVSLRQALACIVFLSMKAGFQSK
jgi:hypothetical protein